MMTLNNGLIRKLSIFLKARVIFNFVNCFHCLIFKLKFALKKKK